MVINTQHKVEVINSHEKMFCGQNGNRKEYQQKMNSLFNVLFQESERLFKNKEQHTESKWHK